MFYRVKFSLTIWSKSTAIKTSKYPEIIAEINFNENTLQKSQSIKNNEMFQKA